MFVTQNFKDRQRVLRVDNALAFHTLYHGVLNSNEAGRDECGDD